MPEPSTRPREPEPIRLVNWLIILWGLGLSALPLTRLEEHPPWIWVAFGAALANIGIGWWGLRTGRWLRPMFIACYLLAFCLVAIAPITNLDIYATTGVLCLVILSMSAAILHRMGPRAP